MFASRLNTTMVMSKELSIFRQLSCWPDRNSSVTHQRIRKLSYIVKREAGQILLFKSSSKWASQILLTALMQTMLLKTI